MERFRWVTYRIFIGFRDITPVKENQADNSIKHVQFMDSKAWTEKLMGWDLGFQGLGLGLFLMKVVANPQFPES